MNNNTDTLLPIKSTIDTVIENNIILQRQIIWKWS